MRRIPAAWVVCVFAVALAVRLLHLAYLSRSPYFEFLLGDADSYHRWAQRIVGGSWLGGEVFYQAPLYPYFLASVYATLGDSAWAIRGVQAVLGASSCALISVAGTAWIGRGAGLCAGLLLAFYAPAIFFDGMLQKSSLDLFILCGLLALLGIRGRPPRPGIWLAIGASTGALALVRENALVLAVVLVAWPLWEAGVDRRRGALATLAFAAGLAGALLPVAVRNHAVGGGFHLTTSQFGTNLYIGNNPQATGSYIPLRPGRGAAIHEREDAIALARQATGRSLSPAQVSEFWTRRAVGWAMANPAQWWRLTGRKLGLLVNAVESVDTEDQYTVADVSPPLRVTAVFDHFGILLPLAVLGVFTTWSRRRELSLLYVMLFAYSASVLVFYVVARYRFPLVPFLALLAGAGVTGASRFARHSSRAAIATCLVAVVATATGSNWSRSSPTLMRAVTHYNLGNAYRQAGATDEAIGQYSLALALHPDFRDARHNLAEAHASLGQIEVADQHYRANLAINPADAAAHNNLGNLLHARGRMDEAAQHYRRAAAMDPLYAVPHYNLGLEAHQRRAFAQSSEHFARALAIDPNYHAARRGLALALYRSGSRTAALPHLIASIEIEPDDPNVLLAAAWLLATHPSPDVRNADQALEFARRASAASRVGRVRALDVLAAAHAETGNFARAIELAVQALERVQKPDGKRARALRARLADYRLGRAHRALPAGNRLPEGVEDHFEGDGLEPDDDQRGHGRETARRAGESRGRGNEEQQDSLGLQQVQAPETGR